MSWQVMFESEGLTGQAERLPSLKIVEPDCRGPGGQGLDKVPESEREAEIKMQRGWRECLARAQWMAALFDCQ